MSADARPPQGADEAPREVPGGGPLRFDCPMCSRVQKVRLADVRCESCGARLRVFSDADAAGTAHDAAGTRSRHLRELPGGLFVVAEL